MIIGLLLFSLIAVIFPILFGLVLARFLCLKPRDVPSFVAYGLGIGPAFLAWIVDVLFRLLPGLPIAFYVAILSAVIVSVVIGALHGLFREDGQAIRAAFRDSLTSFLDQQGRIEWLIIFLLAGSFVFIALYNIAVPLNWHDPIHYTVVAKLLFRDLSAALYPFAEADPQTGYYLEGEHPLGFPASKLIFMLFTGDADTPWHKPLTAAYYAYLVIAVATSAARLWGLRSAAYAGFLVAATPRLLLSALIVHVDPLRVYGFFLPFAFLIEFLRSSRKGWLIGSAIGVAIGLHVHAGNVLIVPFLLVLYLIFSSETFLARCRSVLVLGAFVAVVSGAQYVDNIVRYGTPITTAYEIESLPAFRLRELEAINRSIDTPREVWTNTLAVFTDFQNFGPTPWLGLLGLLVLAATIGGSLRTKPGQSLTISMVVMYFGLAVMGAAFGIDTIYKNPRYPLIVIPFLAIAGSGFLLMLVNIPKANSKPSIIFGIRTFVFISIATFIIPLFYWWKVAVQPNLLPNFWKVERIALSDLEKAEEGWAANVTVQATAARELASTGKAVLTFQDEIYYYGKGYFISEYDVRLAQFYAATNGDDAKDVLKKLGIHYFYIPGSYTPGMSSGNFLNILSDYKHVSLVSQETNTLLRYHSEPRNVTLAPVDLIEIDGGLKLARDRRWMHPAGLEQCDGFVTVPGGGMSDWYRERFFPRPSSPACNKTYDDDNWILISGEGTYRLAIETLGSGCLDIVVFYRLKMGNLRSITATSLSFTSVQQNGLAIYYLRPPEKTDALAIGLAQPCATGTRVTRIGLDRIVSDE